MATGLEAVGAASAIIQLISFAGTLVSLTFKIYDGIPTAENELEDFAAKVSDAANRVETRAKQVPQMTPEERKLSQVAQECVAAAEGLKKEAQSITKGFQKGKVLKAVYAAFRASQHKKKIQGLDQSLKRCKETMETELVLKICDKGTALEQQQSQGFQNLESDVKTLITAIATVNAKIEGLVIQEAKTTREMINGTLVNEFKALSVRTSSEAQRQRLLKSLKSEEIRQRYNDVMCPSDACFERVFASYERVCSRDPKHKAWSEINKSSKLDQCDSILEKQVDEIDQSWETLSSWLRSDAGIFWLQGKPGSGKSTLLKFIINNDNTNSLLNSWSKDTRVLSHFFWKIGQESQKSIKGLMCSLLYDILSNDNVAIDQVLGQFTFSQSRDFYKEWSTEEAYKVLMSLLHSSSRSTCIFIDGLDEISEKDGFRSLMNIIEKLQSCPKVKLCVSSRPETELVSRLKAMGAASLRLEDLTRPEMAIYIHSELCRLLKAVSSSVSKIFETILLQKSQGVFLWLFLATKSLTNGIENGDNEETLRSRLEELPAELEALYEAMWSRLGGNNQVYRETAAKYFNCVIYGGWGSLIYIEGNDVIWDDSETPTLAHLSLVVRARNHMFFPPNPRYEDLGWLNTLCDEAACDIRTRCAGMLRIGRESYHLLDDLENNSIPSRVSSLTRKVEFIHRTAHDFLVDTEAGQAILNYRTGAKASIDLYTKLIQAWLYLINFYSQFLPSFKQDYYPIIRRCLTLDDLGASKSTMLSILSIFQNLSNACIITADGGKDLRLSSVRLLFGWHFASYEDNFISYCVQPDTTDLLTSSLRDIVAQGQTAHRQLPPVKLIQRMIVLGADPHAIGIPLTSRGPSKEKLCLVRETTAFELFLQQADQWHDNGLFPDEILNSVVTMAQTCRDWHRRMVVCCRAFEDGRLCPLRRDTYSDTVLRSSQMTLVLPHVMFEADVQLLFMRLIYTLQSYRLPTHVDNLYEIMDSLTNTHVRVRHIRLKPRVVSGASCYRVLDQQPYEGLISNLCGLEDTSTITLSEVVSVLESLSSSDRDDNLSGSMLKKFEGSFIEVPYSEELELLAEADIGLCRMPSLGAISPSGESVE